MMSSAVPTSGKRQRPMNAVTMKSAATKTAMPARIARPGIVALTSVYAAPLTMSLTLESVTVA